MIDVKDESADAEAPRLDPHGGQLVYDPREPQSDLDLIAAEIIDQVAPPTRLEHPIREGYVLVFDSEIDSAVIDGYVKKATKQGKRDGRLLNGLVVVNHCTAIERRKTPLMDGNDKPITFRSRDLHHLLGVGSAVDAAAKFIGGDGYLAAMAAKVLAKAGYGAVVDEEAPEVKDPTELD